MARLRGDLYAAVMQQDIGFFDQRRTGELTNRLASDTTVLQNAVTVNLSMALRFGLQGVGAIGILLWTSWKLTLVMLTVVPIVAIGAGIYGRKLRIVSKQVQDALAVSPRSPKRRWPVSGPCVHLHGKKKKPNATGLRSTSSSTRPLSGQTRGHLHRRHQLRRLWRHRCRPLVRRRMLSEGELGFGQLTSFLLYTSPWPSASAPSPVSGRISPGRRCQ